MFPGFVHGIHGFDQIRPIKGSCVVRPFLEGEEALFGDVAVELGDAVVDEADILDTCHGFDDQGIDAIISCCLPDAVEQGGPNLLSSSDPLSFLNVDVAGVVVVDPHGIRYEFPTSQELDPFFLAVADESTVGEVSCERRLAVARWTIEYQGERIDGLTGGAFLSWTFLFDGGHSYLAM